MIICGVSLPATPISSAPSVNGSISITAPSIITGGSEAELSLIISSAVSIPAVQSMNSTLILTAEHAEVLSESTGVLLSLSGMEDATVKTTLANALTETDRICVSTEVSEAMGDALQITNTIGDTAYSAAVSISAPLTRSAHRGAVEIRLPSSTGRLINDSLTVIADGIDITSLFISGEVVLVGDNKPMELTAKLKPLAKLPSTLEIRINEETYTFRIVSGDISHTGCSLAGCIDSPYTTLTGDAVNAALLCAENSDIIFAGRNFMTRGLSGTMTEHTLAERLAEMSGGYARQMPGGRSMVFDETSASDYTPENIISWAMQKPETIIGAVEVVYGKNGDDYITLEVSDDILRVYGEGYQPPAVTGGRLIQTGRRDTKSVTESILFVNGVSKLAYPAVSMETDGLTTDGRNVYADGGCTHASVTYSTQYDTYRVIPDADKVAVCVYIENSVVLTIGAGDSSTIQAENICDHTTALRIAETKLKEQQSRLRITTTHSNILNTTSALLINTPYGKGCLTSAKINITNNPVKITDTLEVI